MTGAGQGIGRKISGALAEAGPNVALADLAGVHDGVAVSLASGKAPHLTSQDVSVAGGIVWR